jgi:hypothetical protein
VLQKLFVVHWVGYKCELSIYFYFFCDILPLNQSHASWKINKHQLMFLIKLGRLTLMNGRQRKATHAQMQGNYDYCICDGYCMLISLLILGIENFAHVIFVALYIFRRIAEGLESSLPNLETLVLTGNLIQELADLDPLASIKSLRTLSLLHNPVTTRPHYRLYVAFKLPQIRLLDFRKIKVKVSDLYLQEQRCDGVMKIHNVNMELVHPLLASVVCS